MQNASIRVFPSLFVRSHKLVSYLISLFLFKQFIAFLTMSQSMDLLIFFTFQLDMFHSFFLFIILCHIVPMKERKESDFFFFIQLPIFFPGTHYVSFFYEKFSIQIQFIAFSIPSLAFIQMMICAFGMWLHTWFANEYMSHTCDFFLLLFVHVTETIEMKKNALIESGCMWLVEWILTDFGLLFSRSQLKWN